MQAIQITELAGPAAVTLADVPEPGQTHVWNGEPGVLIDVETAGASFPELLQTRGQYQVAPELPFVPGGEAAGIVRSAPPGSGFEPGDRVAAYTVLGGFAEVACAPPHLTFKLHPQMPMAEGAALVMNYHTAWFALVLRAHLQSGQTVLVQGAAGGVGTAALQIARGLGARTIAVVSNAGKEAVARAAGADEVVRTDGEWSVEARELSDGGVDVVIDPVGGDRFIDSLRALREGGQLIVVGFAGGSIPQVRVNRLLLKNIAVVGAGWGAWALAKPEVCRRGGEEIYALVEAGIVRPVVGATFPLKRAADALALLDERRASGKVVLEVRSSELGRVPSASGRGR